jgi:O-antigen/teichoic acid export membrane protein
MSQGRRALTTPPVMPIDFDMAPMLRSGPDLQEHPIAARVPPEPDSPPAVARGNPLPEGTITVGTGLVIAGLASYGFLAISARALGPDAFAPLSVMWIITFLAGPGFFLPVEQEVSRALAHRRANGIGGGPVIGRAAQLGGLLAAILVVITLIVSPWMVEHLFDGSWLLLVGFLLGLVGYYAGHLGRGTFSGMGRFGAYGLYMGGEGTIRMAFCVALALVGVETVGFYGLAVGIPPLIAVAIAVSREHNLVEPGPPAPWAELTTNLGYLLAGSVFAAFLINAGPITVQLLATPDEETLAGAFTTSTVIARVPLFLFQAVQASLLPKLAALAGAGKFADFRSGFRRLLTVVIALGAVAVVGAFLIGPLVIRILFGEEYDLGRRNITMLAASSALYMVGISMSQALIALHGHARVAIGWICGTIVFIGVVAAGTDLLLRVEAGLVAGSAISLAVFALLLHPLIKRGDAPDEESLVEAFHDFPLEP